MGFVVIGIAPVVLEAGHEARRRNNSQHDLHNHRTGPSRDSAERMSVFMRTKASIERQIEKLRYKKTMLFNGDNPHKWQMMNTIQRKIIDLWASWHRIDERKTNG